MLCRGHVRNDTILQEQCVVCAMIVASGLIIKAVTELLKTDSRLYFLAGNVGADHAIFEQGASAGNVGNERLVAGRTANPTALLLSSAMMLRHLQFPSFADRLEQAVMSVIAEGTFRTKDLGGTSSTQDVVDAVIDKLN
jgi:hypothetical protein